MYWHEAGIQYNCHKVATVHVVVIPEWYSLTCISRILNLNSKCLEGSKYGNLVASLTRPLLMHSPQSSNSSASKYHFWCLGLFHFQLKIIDLFPIDCLLCLLNPLKVHSMKFFSGNWSILSLLWWCSHILCETKNNLLREP